MQKTFFKKLLLLFSAVAFISYGIIWACAGGDWDEYSYSAFTPEAFVESSYKPFFFSEEFYYEIGHDEKHVERFNDAIVKEWNDYLGASYPDKEVRYLLIDASKSMIDSINTVPLYFLPPSINSLKLVQSKSKTNVAAFFAFLGYAKANESYAAARFDYWDYDDDKPRKAALSKEQKDVLMNMDLEFQKTKDNFIKQRYFFQILRAQFFAGNYPGCINFYEKHKTLFPYNILAARCLSYVAGCYYKQKNYAQANYLYSMIYNVGNDFKTVAHFSFHPQNETDWKQTLALCKNKEEQITLWHLIGIYFDEQRAIKEIYALDPKSDKLDLLLARLVNLQERKVNGDSYYNSDFIGKLDSLPSSAINLVSTIADQQNSAKPFFWHLSAGYLHYLKTDYKAAQAYYDKAIKSMPKDNLSKAQLRLFVFMNRLAAAPKLDGKTEELLLPDLLWLQNLNVSSLPVFRYDYAYSWARNLMARKYAAQKEILKSELFHHHDSFYAKPASVNLMKAFLLKQNHSPFEAYCKSIYPIKLESVSEYQSILLAYEDKIDEAIPLIQEAGVLKDGLLLGNPFNGNIKDCHDCEHAAAQKVKYSKIAFLQKLKELKANVAAANDVYNNALLLGNAFYNMTHFGNARFFYEGEVIGAYHSMPEIIPDCFRTMLLDCSIAQKYYRMALASASTDEQKAKVTYLLLKIERNNHYLKLFSKPDYSSWDYADMPPTNFSVLNTFKSTKYYAEVIKECGYFRSYLAKHK
ncbi:MAG: hypothetical protein V4561_05850 [Bacteroidota bacterium]